MLNWNASDDASWLSLTPASGSGNRTLASSVNTAGLAAGTYNGIITVAASGIASKTIARMISFNAERSEQRTNAVDTLFDQLITFQLAGLKAATRTIHDAEAALGRKDNEKARSLLAQARDAIAAMPVTETQASSAEIRDAFTGASAKTTRQAELEQRWAAFAKAQYALANARAEEALKLAR